MRAIEEKTSKVPAAGPAVTPAVGFMPLAISLGVVHKNKLSAGIQAFLDYLGMEPAREILRKTGHVPAAR